MIEKRFLVSHKTLIDSYVEIIVKNKENEFVVICNLRSPESCVNSAVLASLSVVSGSRPSMTLDDK